MASAASNCVIRHVTSAARLTHSLTRRLFYKSFTLPPVALLLFRHVTPCRGVELPDNGPFQGEIRRQYTRARTYARTHKGQEHTAHDAAA